MVTIKDKNKLIEKLKSIPFSTDKSFPDNIKKALAELIEDEEIIVSNDSTYKEIIKLFEGNVELQLYVYAISNSEYVDNIMFANKSDDQDSTEHGSNQSNKNIITSSNNDMSDEKIKTNYCDDEYLPLTGEEEATTRNVFNKIIPPLGSYVSSKQEGVDICEEELEEFKNNLKSDEVKNLSDAQRGFLAILCFNECKLFLEDLSRDMFNNEYILGLTYDQDVFRVYYDDFYN